MRSWHGTFLPFPNKIPFRDIQHSTEHNVEFRSSHFFCAYIKLKIYRKRVMKLTEVVTDTEIQFLSSLPLFR